MQFVQKQLTQFLDFDCGENSAEILNNYDWFKAFNFLDFIRDVGLLIEFVKGTIYRSMGLPHLTQEMFESFVEVTVDPDNNIHSEVDSDLLMKFFGFIGNLFWIC